MLKPLIFLLFFLSGCFAKSDATPEKKTTGRIVKIVDGDTYDLLLDDKKTVKIRMEGIDAPERKMPFYKVAKEHLGKVCFGKTVKIVESSKDRNGRLIAKTFLPGGQEVGLLMIEAGLAWHFKKYSSDNTLARAELQARRNKAGLWIESNPVAPWEYRLLRRK